MTEYGLPPKKGRVGQVVYIRAIVQDADSHGRVWVSAIESDGKEPENHWVKFGVTPDCVLTTAEIRRALSERRT